VGPRPELPEVVAGYEPWQHARHWVRPGITGLWQVTQRGSGEPMHRHVATDLTVDLASGDIEVHRRARESWRVTLVDTGLHTMTGGRVRRIRDLPRFDLLPHLR
jgi:hypothetical protein